MGKKIFDWVRGEKPTHSGLDLSYEVKMSAKFGKLYPILLQEVVPGDFFSGRTEILARMAPMIAPIIHRIDLFVHFYNVPNRIIWDEWEDFITGGDDGTLSPTIPIAGLKGAATIGKGTIADYFGLPTWDEVGDATASISVSTLAWRAYHSIWNEYYRDQNLQEKYDYDQDSGSYLADFFLIRTRAWEKDYFTSALPYPQKGPAVNLPFDSQINYKNISEAYTTAGVSADAGPVETDSSGNVLVEKAGGPTVGRIENIDSIDSGVTIEELRRASRLQEWLEIAARAGSRYKELILSMFNVHTGDARLDRPEYIGGGKMPLTISEVLNTTSEVNIPQGTMAGHGIGVGTSAKFKVAVKEHGHIMGILSILPKSGYQQGVTRMWSRRDKFDYYWPKFAHLGEQEVIARELYHNFDNDTNNGDTFGYQQIYAEYKYNSNMVCGDMRDDLDFWHLSRKFSTRPGLNAEFIECDDDDLTRIFAVDDSGATDKFYLQIYHSLKARRPMPYFADPKL